MASAQMTSLSRRTPKRPSPRTSRSGSTGSTASRGSIPDITAASPSLSDVAEFSQDDSSPRRFSNNQTKDDPDTSCSCSTLTDADEAGSDNDFHGSWQEQGADFKDPNYADAFGPKGFSPFQRNCAPCPPSMRSSCPMRHGCRPKCTPSRCCPSCVSCRVSKCCPFRSLSNRGGPCQGAKPSGPQSSNDMKKPSVTSSGRQSVRSYSMAQQPRESTKAKRSVEEESLVENMNRGSQDRSQASSQARSQARPQARSQARSQSRSQARSQSRSQSQAQPGSVPRAQSRAQSHGQSSVQRQSQSRSQSRAQPRSQSRSQAPGQLGSQSQSRSQSRAQSQYPQDSSSVSESRSQLRTTPDTMSRSSQSRSTSQSQYRQSRSQNYSSVARPRQSGS